MTNNDSTNGSGSTSSSAAGSRDVPQYICQKYWYKGSVLIFQLWSRQGYQHSRQVINSTIVPIYIQYFITTNQDLQSTLPLALTCSCLTAFILPLYEGQVLYLLRWIMTIISALIGPRLSFQNGIYPLLGVLIFGLMVNRPLAVCTICLGAWSSFFLGLVMSRALGLK